VGLSQRRQWPVFPSYESIAEQADCARSTVYEAINALERIGILTWVNRIARIREWGPDLFGRAQNRCRVIRTSNAYVSAPPGFQVRGHCTTWRRMLANTLRNLF
jgi:hypothetical protein